MVKQNIKKIIYRLVPDKLYLKILFHRIMGYKIDFKNPQTFNEKLQWIKLYDRNPLYGKLVDKFRVRKFVEERIGAEYLIPNYGNWNKFSEIDFDSLPDKFVLKTNHDSGGVWLIKDKNTINKKQLEHEINKHLKSNFYYVYREWPYKNVKPSIIAEKFMIDDNEIDLKDYKFYCFNGKVKLLMQVSNRYNPNVKTTMDYYDENFNRVDIIWGYESSAQPVPLPENILELKNCAEKLSKGIRCVRVDLYSINGKIYFGEYTFFDDGGFGKIEPFEMDKLLGSYIDLNDC